MNRLKTTIPIDVPEAKRRTRGGFAKPEKGIEAGKGGRK